jgi:hypothetical protein
MSLGSANSLAVWHHRCVCLRFSRGRRVLPRCKGTARVEPIRNDAPQQHRYGASSSPLMRLARDFARARGSAHQSERNHLGSPPMLGEQPARVAFGTRPHSAVCDEGLPTSSIGRPARMGSTVPPHLRLAVGRDVASSRAPRGGTKRLVCTVNIPSRTTNTSTGKTARPSDTALNGCSHHMRRSPSSTSLGRASRRGYGRLTGNSLPAR